MAASDWQEKTAPSSRSAQPAVHDAGLGLGHEAWNESVPAAVVAENFKVCVVGDAASHVRYIKVDSSP